MKEWEVVYVLKKTLRFYGFINKIKTPKKYKELWLKRGYKVTGSWSVYDFNVGRHYIVRVLDREGLKDSPGYGRWLMEVSYTDKTEWLIYKGGRWLRFNSKCEAQDFWG